MHICAGAPARGRASGIRAFERISIPCVPAGQHPVDTNGQRRRAKADALCGNLRTSPDVSAGGRREKDFLLLVSDGRRAHEPAFGAGRAGIVLRVPFAGSARVVPANVDDHWRSNGAYKRNSAAPDGGRQRRPQSVGGLRVQGSEARVSRADARERFSFGWRAHSGRIRRSASGGKRPFEPHDGGAGRVSREPSAGRAPLRRSAGGNRPAALGGFRDCGRVFAAPGLRPHVSGGAGRRDGALKRASNARAAALFQADAHKSVRASHRVRLRAAGRQGFRESGRVSRPV